MNFKNFFNKKIGLIFIGIIILAIFLRFQGVLTNSFPFTYDIGRDLIDAKAIATLQKIPLIGQTTGLPGLFYGPSWHYFLAFLYHPLSGDPQLFTGFINITGVAMIAIAFILGKRIGGLFLGIIWSGLLAVSPVVISLTSQIWNPDLIPILWIISYVFLYSIFKKNKPNLSFFILGIILALIIDMEIVVGLLYAAGVTISIILVRPRVISIKRALLAIAGFLIIMLPRIVFDIRHENVLSKTLFGGVYQMFIGGGEELSSTPMFQKVLSLFAVWCDSLTLGNRFFGTLLLVFVVIATLFIYKKTEKTLNFFLNTTLIVLLVSSVGLLFFGHDIWEHYLVMFPLLYVSWISIILSILFTRGHRAVVVLVGVIIILNINIPKIYETLRNPLWEGDAAVYRNQLEVVDYVYKESSGRPFKFIVYTPPVHDYTYRYLFDWYGQREYGRSPDNSSKLLFVILEPDHEMPQRLVDWLKIRESDGRVIKETTLKAGIIVQTRETK